MLKPIVVCIVLMAGLLPALSVAVDPAGADQLSAALSSWRSGDLAGAREQLSAMISAGSDDARLYFYRGVLEEQLGGTGDADFRAGADLEASSSSTRAVNRALEATQGALRTRIEKLRAEARNRFKSDPEAAKNNALYRDALAARAAGDLTTAIQKLQALCAEGDDPRYFYMHGVALAESGDVESAKAAFRDGLQHERTSDDVANVSLALTDVQGEVRRLIEEETNVAFGDQVLSRQANREQIRRMAMVSGDSVLAEVDAANVAAAARLALEQEAGRLAAAERIAAANRASDALAAKVAETAVVEPAVPSPARPSRTSNPAAEMPAEAPLVAGTAGADPAAAANPFISGLSAPDVRPGNSVPSVPTITPGPIDMSYLPATTEFITYLRPGDLLSSGFVKPLADMPHFSAAIAQMSAGVGFTPSDIDSVTVGMSNLMASLMPIILQAGSGTPPDPNAITQQLLGGENFVVVVRLNRDVDAAALMQQAQATEGTHEGTTYYLLPNPDPAAPQMALQVIDSKTCVVSSEPGIKAVITNGAGEATRDGFGFVSRSSHYVQAFSSPLLAGMSGSIPVAPEGAPPQVGALFDAVRGKVAGVAFTADAGSNLSVKLNILLTEPEAASAALAPLQQLAAMGQQSYPAVSANVPQPLQQPAGQIVTSLKVSASESTVSVSVSIPGSLVTTLMEHPELMSPGVPPGGAPPGFGTPGGGAISPGSPPTPGFGPPDGTLPIQP